MFDVDPCASRADLKITAGSIPGVGRPKAFGIRSALGIARLFHVVTVLLLLWMVVAFGLGKIAVAGVAFVALLLIYEHSLVRHNDLSKVNAAFFTMNGLVSMAFLFFIAADRLLRSSG